MNTQPDRMTDPSAATGDDIADASPHTPRLHVQMIGDPGVGKTSFLGALGLIAQAPDHRLMVTPIGSQTKRRLDDLRAHFGNGSWPTKTFHGQSFTFQLHRRHQTVTLQVDDIPGEAFVEAMRRGAQSTGAIETNELIRKTDLLLLMIDGGKLDTDQPLPEADLIQAVNEKRLALGNSLPHVAVVVTKADLCTRHPLRRSAQVEQRVTQRMPALAEFLRRHVDQTAWLAVSVCGFDFSPTDADADAVPGPATGKATGLEDAVKSPAPHARSTFSPTGFDALLGYLITIADQPRHRFRRTLAALILAALFFVVAVIQYNGYDTARQRAELEDPQRRVQELPTRLQPANEPIYRSRVLELVRAASQDIEAASAVREVDDILQRVSDLPPLAQRLAADELSTLDKQSLQRKESILFERVNDAAQSSDVVRIGIAVDQYLNLFPSGPRAPQVRSLLSKQEDKRRVRARDEIKSITVRDAATLERKLQRIGDYLNQFESVVSPGELEQIRLAIDAARTMLRPSRYDVTLVRTAGLDRPRAHGITVSVDGAEIAKFDDSGTVSEKIWNRTFHLRWQVGNRIEITLDNYRYRNNTIAHFDAAGPLAILVLAGKNQPTRFGQAYVSDPPNVTVTMKCQQLPDATVAAISQWIFPGDAW